MSGNPANGRLSRMDIDAIRAAIHRETGLALSNHTAIRLHDVIAEPYRARIGELERDLADADAATTGMEARAISCEVKAREAVSILSDDVTRIDPIHLEAIGQSGMAWDALGGDEP